MQAEIFPGTRVKVFDWTLFENDKDTPLSFTMRMATVIKRYGQVDHYNICGEKVIWKYEDLVDVIFDHRPNEISKGHFTRGVSV